MYEPDKWIILKIKSEKETFYRILAGWNGGYLAGNSWRINSGITKVTEEDNFILFHGHSGSTYKCHKKAYGTTSMSEKILNNILSDPATKEKVEVVSESESLNLRIN